MQVQRNWMYLENIFIGSEDIRKQLPQESLMFEKVHKNFMACMHKLKETGSALKATTAKGMLATFQVRRRARLLMQPAVVCRGAAHQSTCAIWVPAGHMWSVGVLV
jgi:Dynein heavy chain, N-terminal region 2